MFNQMAMVTEAGYSETEAAFDIYLRNRTIGLVIVNRTNGTARAMFSETRSSQRKFANAQDAVGYLVERRENLIAKRRAA